MKRTTVTAFSILLGTVTLLGVSGQSLTTTTYSSPGPSQRQTREQTSYSRSQVLLLAGSGYTSFAAQLLLAAYLSPPANDISAVAAGAVGTIPLWLIRPASAAVLTGSAGGLFAASILTPTSPDLWGDGNATLRGDMGGIAFHLSLWSSYEAYAIARMKVKGAESIYHYRDYSFGRLFASPFEPANLGKLSFWLPLAGVVAVVVVPNLIRDGGANSVFSTGRAYIGTTSVPVLLGLLSTLVLSAVSSDFTAISEEAVFRDMEYKELSISLGPVPAGLLDATAFAAYHLPLDQSRGAGVVQMAENYAVRFALTFGLQWAYNQGGLPEAVALHAWVDTTASVAYFLLESGKASAGLPLIDLSYRF